MKEIMLKIRNNMNLCNTITNKQSSLEVNVYTNGETFKYIKHYSVICIVDLKSDIVSGEISISCQTM